jgi:hypothetical protein
MFNSVVSFIFVGVNFHGFEGTEKFAYIPIHDFDPVTGLPFHWCQFAWI